MRNSCFVRSGTSPMAIVTAESPTNPWRVTPTSIERMSPSASTTSSLGMPWTIMVFGEAQIEPGKPR